MSALVGWWSMLFFKDTAPTETSTLSLHDSLPICLLPLKPQVILMDEPCSALDVEGTRAIEELMWALRGKYTILIRSEEHTPELQSRQYLVCRLLLEKKLITHVTEYETTYNDVAEV